MGLDYSYELYFHRDKLWPVLESVASFNNSEDQIDVIFPDGHKLTLPFRSDYGTTYTTTEKRREDETQPIYFEPASESLRFVCLSLRFEMDTVLDKDWDHKGRYSLGCIDLTIELNLSYYDKYISNRYNPDLINLSFCARTSSISRLFEKSPSIRRTFCRLLEEHDGVCGLFDDEREGAEGWLIWPEEFAHDKWEGLKKKMELLTID